MNLCSYEEISALLERHGFHFSRSMGQNFLIDPAVPRAIAEAAALDPAWGVVEIGPGVGALTAELSARAGRVAAVEVDWALLPVLQEALGEFANTEIIRGDATKLDLAALAAEKLSGLRPAVCSNLPYNITTPVLTRLAQTPCFETLTLMLQREAAMRVCAGPGEDGFGPLSLLMDYRFERRVLFDVPSECFYPRPKVTSSVLRCVRRQAPPAEVLDETFFFRVLRGAFMLRRKTLINSLAAALPELGRATLAQALDACGLAMNLRGEQVSLQEFAKLSNNLCAYKK